MANECIDYYRPGEGLTGIATGAITGCRFLMISGDKNATSGGVAENLISVVTATAAGRICGVAQADAASGSLVGVVRGNSRVVPVDAGGTIAAFAEVEVGTAGKAVAKSAGVAVGYVLTGAVNNGVAMVSLY